MSKDTDFTVGFGTYKLKGAEGRDSIVSAIGAGYRLIDTAYNYENEGTVGAAVAASDVPRSELFVQSKLPGRYQGAQDVRITVEESLFRLGLDYVDSYLIHWPNPKQGKFVGAFEELLKLRDEGLIRNVGVCNFQPEHVEELKAATGEYPWANQIELHPYFPQEELRAFDAEHGIQTQAWSPLVRGMVFEEEPIAAAARSHDASAGQIVLAWHIAVGAVAIPKATSAERQQQNFAAQEIELTAEEVSAISALGNPNGRIKAQDPNVYEEF